MFLLGAIEVVADLIVADGTQVGQVLPDGVFQIRGMLAATSPSISRNRPGVPRRARAETDAGIRVIAVYEITQVRVRKWAQHKSHVKVATRHFRGDAFRPMERHDDVGKPLLGADKVGESGSRPSSSLSTCSVV